MNNKTKMLLLLPPILFVLCVIAAGSLPFDQSLSESESQILDFISSDLKIIEQQKSRIVKNIKGPFDFAKHSGPVQNVKVSKLDYNERSLSLTVITDNARMAVINGEPVKEGDIVDGMKIKKIEPERVLVKNKTAKWLYLEKTQ